MALKGEPFKKIGSILKKVAPTLLAGATGGAAPLAMSIAKNVLGDDQMSDEKLEESIASLTGNAGGIAKLREIDAALKKAEMDNGFKFAELDVKDRIDARALAKGRSIIPWLVLTALFVGGYFSVLVFVLYGVFYGIAAGMVDPALLAIASTLLGVLTGEVPRIMAWWFGSSQSSQTKTDAMNDALKVLRSGNG